MYNTKFHSQKKKNVQHQIVCHFLTMVGDNAGISRTICEPVIRQRYNSTWYKTYHTSKMKQQKSHLIRKEPVTVPTGEETIFLSSNIHKKWMESSIHKINGIDFIPNTRELCKEEKETVHHIFLLLLWIGNENIK